MNMHNVPALQRNLREVVEEYEAKKMAIVEIKKSFDTLVSDVARAVCIGGTYAGSGFERSPHLSEDTMARHLLESAWRYVYKGLNISTIASAADRSRFELALVSPPEFTLENVAATFGDYVRQPRFHILKGLAECFTGLDPAYKSHSKVKVGVAGLPKRVIINNVVGDYGVRGYGSDRLKDTINALNVFQGEPHIDHQEFYDLVGKAHKQGSADYKGLTLKVFGNGNGHLIFSPHKLVLINDALAEFYGDVLPDAPEENAKKRPGTAVAKDLQFYPTPVAVINKVLYDFHIDEKEPRKLLEPSCGDGRILDVIREVRPNIKAVGIEYDQDRAHAASIKGHAVLPANFLQVKPNPVYDYVVMNPPFYGLHWRKHLDHAIQFLRPAPPEKKWDAGRLVAILPATAWYDGHLDDLKGEWRDLPVASFAESGTNVPTGYFKTIGEKK